MSEWLGSPLIELIILAALSWLGRALFMRRGNSPTASGAIAMTIGIFVLGALRQMPFDNEQLTRLLTIEGLIVWAFIAASYVRSYLHGTFHLHIEDPVGCFAVGTWVAGTAVLSNLTSLVLPQWRLLSIVLAVVAVVIWLWFLLVISSKVQLILPHPTDMKVTGRILLVVVSTQSLVVMAEQLFPQQTPRWLVMLLIYGGYVFYFIGLLLIFRRYRLQRGWRLTEDWDNTNCIIHGAMSITGLAGVASMALPDGLLVATWYWAVLMFVFIEAIELARLVARVRAYGWQRGVFSYNVSQWARNFTFGMFYTFTLRLHATLGAGADLSSAWLPGVQAFIIAYGQYVVLFLLLVELALFAARNININQPWARTRELAQ